MSSIHLPFHIYIVILLTKAYKTHPERTERIFCVKCIKTCFAKLDSIGLRLENTLAIFTISFHNQCFKQCQFRKVVTLATFFGLLQIVLKFVVALANQNISAVAVVYLQIYKNHNSDIVNKDYSHQIPKH